MNIYKRTILNAICFEYNKQGYKKDIDKKHILYTIFITKLVVFFFMLFFNVFNIVGWGMFLFGDYLIYGFVATFLIYYLPFIFVSSKVKEFDLDFFEKKISPKSIKKRSRSFLMNYIIAVSIPFIELIFGF
ncbi:hypothetical protein [Flammeovirga sp. SJP92]|uniref:hypothetical protein n=1 Tax=Flammeovirga sp. SJP92 TaxID=1775430 RepID=UPI00078885B5|nr:hypothetical protein [Flammeovirga sp. SJP92]KXX69478.1 hypothetical protein AVL50_16305 [Flammeovirga sp. SJP92]